MHLLSTCFVLDYRSSLLVLWASIVSPFYILTHITLVWYIKATCVILSMSWKRSFKLYGLASVCLIQQKQVIRPEGFVMSWVLRKVVSTLLQRTLGGWQAVVENCCGIQINLRQCKWVTPPALAFLTCYVEYRPHSASSSSSFFVVVWQLACRHIRLMLGGCRMSGI